MAEDEPSGKSECCAISGGSATEFWGVLMLVGHRRPMAREVRRRTAVLVLRQRHRAVVVADLQSWEALVVKSAAA